MAERLYCRQGHSWEPAIDRMAPVATLRSVCPVCGREPLNPFDMTQRTAIILVAVAAACGLAALVCYFLGAYPGVVVALIVALLMPVFALVAYYQRRRTQAMAAVCEAMGMTFMPMLTQEQLQALGPFRLFTPGHTKKASNAMLGSIGDCEAVLFEYRYTVGSGKHSHTYTHTAVVIPNAAAGLPDFQVAPRTFFDKLASFFTHRGVDLEDAGAFAGRCMLTGPDEGAIREVFHPDLTDFLGRDGQWFVEVVYGQLLVYRQRQLPPPSCPGLVADALVLRDLIRGVKRKSDAFRDE